MIATRADIRRAAGRLIVCGFHGTQLSAELKEILREDGRITAIRMVNHVLGETDDSGRRRPEEVEGTE